LLRLFIFSLSDEFHQLFVVGRSGNFLDVGFDLSGAMIGGILFWRYVVLTNKKEQ
jgi:VanZ family protein